jgi:uncharacterized protein YukE
MRYPKLALCGVFSLCLTVIVGCSLFSNGAPPTKAEQAIYNVRTNYLEVVVPRTNFVPVTVLVTNTQGVTAYQTNIVPVVIQGTNEVPQYTYAPKPGTTTGVQVAGTAINTFFPGIGGLVSTGLTALVGLWGYIRSSKNYNTGAALAQEVQTIRQFVQGLPNGATYDAAFTQFLQAHQADANVLNQVVNLINNEVSNSDAQVAAQQIQQTIAALSGGTVNPTTPAAAVSGVPKV